MMFRKSRIPQSLLLFHLLLFITFIIISTTCVHSQFDDQWMPSFPEGIRLNEEELTNDELRPISAIPHAATKLSESSDTTSTLPSSAVESSSVVSSNMLSSPVPSPTIIIPQSSEILSDESRTSIVVVLPCPNNCSENGICNTTTGECQCYTHFSLEDCSRFEDPELHACPNKCSSQGQCNQTTGVCECYGDYFGEDCSMLPCPNNCSKIGTCNFTTGQCLCPEPFYLDCSLKKCPSDCLSGLGHGVCNSVTGICDCFSNFTGNDCSLHVCPNDCSSHGTCNTTNGICTCDTRYFAPDCSQKTCLDPTCGGVGTCNTTSGTCDCDSKHSGERCQLRLCANNCSYPHGECDFQKGICKCLSDWSGDSTCSVNIHIRGLEKIKNWNTGLGTIWICLISIGLPFFASNALWAQLLSGVIHLIQFIGLSSLIGSYVPPLFLKFCAFFEWSNFIFDLNVRSHQFKTVDQVQTFVRSISSSTNVLGSTSNYYDLRQEMNENGLIVFLDNFILVCMVVILTLIFNGLIILYRMNKSQRRQIALEHNLFISFIHLAIIAYIGVTSSVMYEIQLAFRGRVIVITLLVAFALLVGYLWGVPFISIFALYKKRSNSYRQNSSDATDEVLNVLSQPFKPEFYSFVAIIFAKNFLLGSLFGLFTNSPKDQCVGLLIILLAYLLVILVTKPYRSHLRNLFEIAMTMVQLLTIIIALLYSTALVTSLSTKNFLCVVGIIIPNVGLLSATLLFIVYCLLSGVKDVPIADHLFKFPERYEDHKPMLFDEDELYEMGSRSILEDDDEYGISTSTKKRKKQVLFADDDEDYEEELPDIDFPSYDNNEEYNDDMTQQELSESRSRGNNDLFDF